MTTPDRAPTPSRFRLTALLLCGTVLGCVLAPRLLPLVQVEAAAVQAAPAILAAQPPAVAVGAPAEVELAPAEPVEGRSV